MRYEQNVSCHFSNWPEIYVKCRKMSYAEPQVIESHVLICF